MPGRDSSPIDRYLDELAGSLPGGLAARELLDEVRDHLCEAAAAGEVTGANRDAAEREAVRQLGGVAALAPQFRAAAVVWGARRQVARQLLGAALLAGWGLGVAHLLPGTLGQPSPSAHPSPLAHAAAIALIGPALFLLGLSRSARPWRDARWLAWLARAQTLASWLFQPAMVACAVLLAQRALRPADAPHLWAAAVALGSHLIACVLVPIAGAAHLPGLFTRRR